MSPEGCDCCVSLAIELFRRKSCVIAMPMEAKARDVRSQARNVRSLTIQITQVNFVEKKKKRLKEKGRERSYPTLDDLSQRSPYFQAPMTRISPQAAATMTDSSRRRSRSGESPGLYYFWLLQDPGSAAMGLAREYHRFLAARYPSIYNCVVRPGTMGCLRWACSRSRSW